MLRRCTVLLVLAFVGCNRDGLSGDCADCEESEPQGQEGDPGPGDTDDVPTCGNGLIDEHERCDPGITSGEGSCPTSCVPVDPCLVVTVVGEGCLVRCESTGSITDFIAGDGCCPHLATADDDTDCEAGPACGNGELDEDEACDIDIASGPGACPSSCGTVGDCSTSELVGDECQAHCEVTLNAPVSGDGCCLGPAYTFVDDDCADVDVCLEPEAAFTAKQKWKWEDVPLSLELTASTASAPLVAQLTDDNDDGVIDGDDTPDILMIVYGLASAAGPGASLGNLVLLSGDNGDTHWIKNNLKVAPFATPAFGDLDHDGRLEIVFVEAGGDDPMVATSVVALEDTGAFKWRSTAISQSIIPDGFAGLSIADLDGDGRPEVLFGNRVFGSDGVMKWEGPELVDYPPPVGRMSLGVELGGPPGLEVVDGNAVYSATGDLLWRYDAFGYGFATLGDCTGDGIPEILLTGQPDDPTVPAVVLLDGDGNVLEGPTLVPVAGRPSTPGASGDIDGDGSPEFVFGATTTLVALDCGLDVVMTAPIVDISGACGPVLFDFDGDGKNEVVHIDELKVRVIDHDGDELWSDNHPSLTGLETAAVADVDGDGEADLIVPQGRLVTGPPMPAGVIVYESNGVPWRGAPKMWNQHAYRALSIFEDGTVPTYEGEAFSVFDGMRAQRSLALGGCP